MLPVLRLAGDGDIHTSVEAVEHLARLFAITPEERAQRLPSGLQPLIYNRTHWALTYLRRASILESAGRGKFRITERGRGILGKPPPRLDLAFLAQYPEVRAFMGKGEAGLAAPLARSVLEATLSPEEELEAVYRTLRAELELELVDRLKTGSPLFFEKAVLAVLTGMGYGRGQTNAAQHLGRPGDEGLDGVINEDALGLDKIYVQAKRYADRIGQEQVRSFSGSLDGAHASKGVMITTSTFSPEAYRWVERIEKRLVLIDGAQLARYMVDYEIGVHLKAQFRMYRVDDDFFDPAG